MTLESLPRPRSLTALILAGGKSRRMGRDKALLQVQARPLLTQLIAAAENFAQSVQIITPWPDRYRKLVSPRTQFIVERNPAGPLQGFRQGLSAVSTPWVLLLACDLPFLTHAQLKLWLAQIESSPTAIAYLPRSAKGWEPLCGFYRRDCAASLAVYLEKFPSGSFQDWLKTQQVSELSVCDRKVLFNCNTPADYQRALSEQGDCGLSPQTALPGSDQPAP
ncbi:MAG: molybdenum cofactor guanylyltransferase [Cyanobacteria bacterium P01_H01_bin.15]